MRGARSSSAQRVVGVILLAILLALVYLMMRNHQQRWKEWAYPMEVIEATSEIPTVESREFWESVLSPAIHRIVTRYPNQELRQEFFELWNRIEHKDVFLCFMVPDPEDVDENVRSTAATSGVTAVGLPVLTLNFVGMQERMRVCQSNLECFEDELLFVVLHEKYHIDHHVFSIDPRKREQITISESEAWFDAADHVVPNMISSGRLKYRHSGGLYETLLSEIKAADHNIHADRWKQFVRESFIPPP